MFYLNNANGPLIWIEEGEEEGIIIVFDTEDDVQNFIDEAISRTEDIDFFDEALVLSTDFLDEAYVSVNAKYLDMNKLFKEAGEDK